MFLVRRRSGGQFKSGRRLNKGLHPLVKYPIPVGFRPRFLLAAALIPCLLAATGWTQTWRQARPGYRLQFPRDHASHPEYRIEWWYYTGNLVDSSSRRFGFQLTFFRAGVRNRPENPSRWAVRDLFMAHLALSDLETGVFRFAERLNRAGPGWAGAATETYRVWNESWEASLDSDGRHRLRARDRDFGIDLELEPGRKPLLHGQAGLSRKGAQDGNASHYYSLTRMPTRGRIRMDGREFDVSGLSWMDHEFGTSFLEAEQIGWDWFALQLDSGQDLMLFQVRRSDGRLDAHAGGTLLEASGQSRALGRSDFTMEPVRTWQSPHSGARYPVQWRLNLPGQRLSLTVTAAQPDQELRTPRSTQVTYWEGAVVVTGTRGSGPVAGRGYLEMTGYAGQSMSEVFRGGSD